MAINLSISFSTPGSIAQQIRYARVDNVVTPVYISVPNITGSSGTFVIATNIPDGQYIISRIPIYADGRVCQARTATTPACPGLISISAVIQTGVLVVSYLAPSSVPSVLINVNYPNGGSFTQIYTNNGNPISIGLPVGVYGNYSVNGQSVCDASSGFYSSASSSVTVNYSQPISGSYYLGNTISAACGASVTTLYTNGSPVPGSVLFTDAGLSNPITGNLYVIYAGIIYNLNSSSGVLGTDTGVTCNVPSFVQITYTSNGTTTQIAQVGPNVAPGNRFVAQVYSHPVTYVAISGDTPNTVAIAISNAINATTEAQWNDHGSAPAHGTTGFPPTATVTGSNITVVLDRVHSFSFNAYVV